jgi:hypothetical protein
VEREPHKPISRPNLREEPVLGVDVLITRRPGGEYLARVSLDENPGWQSCTAEDPFDALDAAMRLAREELVTRLGDPFAADPGG